MDYTIAAIPTVYRGRRYRSRLEARWAAFFDILGWQHEYEPRDLGKWSPDFAVWGRRADFPLLVEVKPITSWDRSTARKMADACAGSELLYLLVGSQPEINGAQCGLGWLGREHLYEAIWTEAMLGIDSLGRPDINPNDCETFCGETVLWEMPETCRHFEFEYDWAKAANAVQWKPKS